jgi:hypothetical protein
MADRQARRGKTLLMASRGFRVSQSRGRCVPSTLSPRVPATVHPSSILRGRGEARRAAERAARVADLRTVAAALRPAPQAEEGDSRR